MARLSYSSQNSLSCLFPVRVCHRGHSWGIWRPEGEQWPFHGSHLAGLLTCLTGVKQLGLRAPCPSPILPQTEPSSRPRVMCLALDREHRFCWIPSSPRSEATGADIGHGPSLWGSSSSLWGPVYLGLPTLLHSLPSLPPPL